jgi:hypothetical protein
MSNLIHLTEECVRLNHKSERMVRKKLLMRHSDSKNMKKDMPVILTLVPACSISE